MKQFTLLAALAAIIIGASAAAGAVRANEMAEKAAQNVQTTPMEEKVTVATLDEVSAAELQVLIDTNPELVIIDARAPEQFAQGHIPNAIQMRPDDLTTEKLAALAPSKETALVFYCGNRQCPASGKAAHKAAEEGYTTLYKYTDGIEDWQAKGLPVAKADTAE